MSLRNKKSKYSPVVRTNASNIPGGRYVNIKANNLYDSEYSIGGPIKDLDGKIVDNTLNQWRDKNPYTSQFDQPFNLDEYYRKNPVKDSAIKNKIQNKINKVEDKLDSYITNVKEKASGAFSSIGSFFNQTP
tara:strand:- start:435 stop:830 length:396 start_codon:yes stop_codon:yes gene_type:complete